jgi:hypothetical protein
MTVTPDLPGDDQADEAADEQTALLVCCSRLNAATRLLDRSLLPRTNPLCVEEVLKLFCMINL